MKSEQLITDMYSESKRIVNHESDREEKETNIAVLPGQMNIFEFIDERED